MEKSVVMLGTSAAMRAIEEDITLAARSDAKVLITGESGVGKELVARLIHERSHRSQRPLVTINCAGFTDGLLESELFGHVRGSFTDAHRDKRGWLESAHRSTILMDEVGEMSLRMQALLLRFLESGEIQRVGSDSPQPPLDVRVIAATHRRLADRVADQQFREDLFYRLNVVQIDVPPLRDRRGDLFVLLNHFLRLLSEQHRQVLPEVTPEALQRLLEYHWPGNVRELRNVVERLIVRCRGGRIDVEALPGEILESAPERPARTKAGGGPAAAPGASKHRHLFERLLKERVSFWSEVYEPFMRRDLTRDDLRELVRLGLLHTQGNYKMLVGSFNMGPSDYKRFLSFLRSHQCHLSFQQFRTVPAGPPRTATTPTSPCV